MVVWDSAAMPSMHRWPSHHADEMVPMLDVPSSFSVETNTTGVPQYIIDGVMTE